MLEWRTRLGSLRDDLTVSPDFFLIIFGLDFKSFSDDDEEEDSNAREDNPVVLRAVGVVRTRVERAVVEAEFVMLAELAC